MQEREKYISTTTSSSVRAHLINSKRPALSDLSSRIPKSFRRKSTKRLVIRYAFLTANILILGAVVSFVAISSHGNSPVIASASAASNAAAVTTPVDSLTSYDIAANIAQATSLPEKTAINNQAQSAKVALAVLSTSDSSVVAKPQIVATALKSKKDIKSYTVISGEDVASIAQKFGVTSDSIKWSNNLSTNSVSAGTQLTIPPVNGIVYTVKDGDTVQSLATKFKANADQITAYNDAELNGLKTGEQIIVPGGQQQVVVTASAIAATSFLVSAGSFSATYGGNGYDYGYCTWYVATQVSVPTNWGNANTWAYYAALSGWNVSSTPVVGAIGQTSAGYEGHVAYVTDVSPDGTQMKYRDMNGLAGFGRVGYSDWVSISKFQHYIYH